MTRLAPRLDVLSAAQRALWPELAGLPRGFVLYGGTALALRLGHRVSVDFDFSLIAQKTLAYFEGGDLASLPEDVKRKLTAHATRDVEVRALPKRSERLDG